MPAKRPAMPNADTGWVGVTLQRENGHAVIKVEDTGVGMDDVLIRERLFRPFVSTKGTGMAIGADECEEYIQEIMAAESQPGHGSCLAVRLPRATEIIGSALTDQPEAA